MLVTDVTVDNLNAVAEFDSPFIVLDNGDIDTNTPDIYAPDVYDDQVSDGWELLSGYTNQYSYHGPTMHPSEYLAGRMARDILDTPGIYVVVEMRDENGEYPDGDPIGWAVARKLN